MRIDKFLRDSRIIKRRTVAQNACNTGRVKINSKVSKAGDRVTTGDIITVDFGNGTNSYEVINTGKDLINPRPDELIRSIE